MVQSPARLIQISAHFLVTANCCALVNTSRPNLLQPSLLERSDSECGYSCPSLTPWPRSHGRLLCVEKLRHRLHLFQCRCRSPQRVFNFWFFSLLQPCELSPHLEMVKTYCGDSPNGSSSRYPVTGWDPEHFPTGRKGGIAGNYHSNCNSCWVDLQPVPYYT